MDKQNFLQDTIGSGFNHYWILLTAFDSWEQVQPTPLDVNRAINIACKIVEFNGEQDHIHLLFQYHPEVQLSRLVNSLKSVSSRKLRQEFLLELEKTYYQKKVVWNSSYFLASCGGVTISTLRKYIENQDKPIT
ncbi:hypothetical protein H1P_380013 [Hyella patelloides LEGE 07179]|uniref:Transposase IS200-like domain-containing protein n=1 Tax=Hyella patelloides LEGE 07179 TaxID=945734 RepID=A0A563VWM9_9CYAN|nr:hypothetical protein H1P_380013 [Hyella patelloides LEGE 07179]